MDGETPLPDRPRLRPTIDVAPLTADRVLVRGHRGTVALAGPFVAEALPSLLARLDGAHSLATLLDEAGDVFRRETEHFLRMLHARGYLCAEQGVEGGHSAYWSEDTLDAAGAVARLSAARILVIGGGRIATELAEGLSEAGIGRVDQLAREVLLTDDSDPTWKRAADSASLIVLASESMSLAGVDEVGNYAVAHRVPWMTIHIDRARALIGPYVIPGETACFACYELRARSNAAHPEDHEALHRHWRGVGDRPADAATPPGAPRIIGAWVALDLARAIAGGRRPTTTGRLLDLDLQTLQSTPRAILRLPRCPVCSRLHTRPLTQIWDIPPRRVAVEAD